MALFQTSSSRMTCALMGLQPVSLESQNAMSAVDGATIERRIRISRPDEGRGRCKGSRAGDPRKDFSQCMPQPIILSTSSAISPQQERTEPSGHRPCRRDVKSSLRREPDVPGDLLRAIFGNVTEPCHHLAAAMVAAPQAPLKWSGVAEGGPTRAWARIWRQTGRSQPPTARPKWPEG